MVQRRSTSQLVLIKMATINHILTNEQHRKIVDEFSAYLYDNPSESYYTSKKLYLQKKYKAKFVPNPNPHGSLKFESEKDRTWFLLQI